MSILIKGMEMPSGCISCPLKSYGTIDEFKYYCDMTGASLGEWCDKRLDKRHKDCPLVEEKTGKWLIPQRRGVMSWNEKAYAECSVCHEVMFNARSMKFCPQCGAKME